MRISDWSSDVCSSDLRGLGVAALVQRGEEGGGVGPDVDARPVVHLLPAGQVVVLAVVLEGQLVDHVLERCLGGRREQIEGARRGGDVAAEGREVDAAFQPAGVLGRSEEHTSELQSLMRISYAVFSLKKQTKE